MHLETRALVTRGAGFLGSHLCERVLDRGAEVIGVDNHFTGTRRNIEGRRGHDIVLFGNALQALSFGCVDHPIGGLMRPMRAGLLRSIAYFERLPQDDAVRPVIGREQGAGA